MKLEKEDERKFVKRVKKDFGAMVVKFSDPARAGAPDRIIMLPGGSVLFIEFKRAGGILRKSQRRYIDDLMRLGFRVYVCYSWQDAYERVKERGDA